MSKNTQISELINYLSFDGSGNIFFNTVSAATTNTDKFLVSDAGTLKFRTAAQLLSDIGAQASGSYQAALSGTGFVKISGSTISYDNSTYLTTASANSTYLPLTGGTLTGALTGTSATFSSTLTANTGAGATFRAVFDSTNIVEIGNYSVASGYQGLNIIGSPIKFYTSTPGAGGGTLALTIATNQLATFSNDILLSKSVDPKISSGTNIGLNIDGAALYLNRYSQSNIVMVQNGGQVGIGDVPSYTLHVKKNANAVAGFESPNANTWIDIISTKGNWSIGSSSTDTSSFGVYQRVNSTGVNVNKEFLNVNSSGYLGVNLQGGSAGFQITSPDYDGYEAVTMLGTAQPTIRYAGSNRFNITSSGGYCGLRTQSSRWRYMRIEADIKSTDADHFGFFWSSDKPSSLGIGDSNVGYKWVFQPSSNTINIRDINSNGDSATSSTVPFDEKDGNWHHYVTELSHDGRVKIWVDGVLYHNRYGYNPGFGYCGILNYIGTIEVSNFTITSSETVVQDVAFFAFHNGGDVNYVPNNVLPYQNELYDYGGGYNTNGTYTAPVAGMYMFSATCNANATSSGTYSTIVPRAYWQINSANIGYSIHFRGNDLGGAATSGLTQRSATVVLYLNYGDTVRIQVQQGQYDLFGANHFCGYLLK